MLQLLCWRWLIAPSPKWRRQSVSWSLQAAFTAATWDAVAVATAAALVCEGVYTAHGRSRHVWQLRWLITEPYGRLPAWHNLVDGLGSNGNATQQMLSVSMCMQLHSTALRIVLHGVHRQRSLVRPLGAATVTCCGFPNSQCTSTVASPSQWPLFRHFVRSSRNVPGPWTLVSAAWQIHWPLIRQIHSSLFICSPSGLRFCRDAAPVCRYFFVLQILCVCPIAVMYLFFI